MTQGIIAAIVAVALAVWWKIRGLRKERDAAKVEAATQEAHAAQERGRANVAEAKVVIDHTVDVAADAGRAAGEALVARPEVATLPTGLARVQALEAAERAARERKK